MKGPANIMTVVILSGFLFFRCATYHLTTHSLLEQCADAQPQKKITLLIAPPFFFFPGIVNGNDLTELYVFDQHENEKVIPVTNHTGIRITKKDNSKSTFYFDTVIIKDSTITGSKTHFFNAQIKPINLKDISKIEIQK
jgi:hypothetical protein